MAKRKLTPEILLKLQKRMEQHAASQGHREPEELAAEYVVRLLEGLHQRATIGQAYIDIVRLASGRKGIIKEDLYKARQALTMVATSEEQERFFSGYPMIEDISVDQRIDLARAINGIKCARTRKMFTLLIEGWSQKDIATEYGLTESRVNQIINRQLDKLCS